MQDGQPEELRVNHINETAADEDTTDFKRALQNLSDILVDKDKFKFMA